MSVSSSSSTALLAALLNDTEAQADPFGLRKRSQLRDDAPLPAAQSSDTVDSAVSSCPEADKENVPVPPAVEFSSAPVKRPFLTRSRPISRIPLATAPANAPRPGPVSSIVESSDRPRSRSRSRSKSRTRSSAANDQEEKIEFSTVSFSRDSSLDFLSSCTFPGAFFVSECSAVVDSLCSKQWSSAVATLTQFRDFFASLGRHALPESSAHQFIALLSFAPSWKPVNQATLKALTETAAALVDASESISPSWTLHISSELLGRGSDRKTRDLLRPVLLSLGEAAGPRVLASAIERFFSQQENRNLKAIEFGLEVLIAAVREFGSSVFDTFALVRTAKSLLDHPNKQIRDSAVGLAAATIKSITLPSLAEALLLELKRDLKSSALSLIDSALAAESDSQPAGNTRTARGAFAQPPKSASDPESAIPRVDLMEFVSDSMVSSLSDTHWKVRNSALDDIIAALKKCGNRFQCSKAKLFESLAELLTDNNKILVQKSLSLLRSLCRGLGASPAAGKLIQRTISSAVVAITDSKPAIRSESAAFLSDVAAQYGVASMQRTLLAALDGSQPHGKEEILGVLEKELANVSSAPERAEWIRAILPRALDRTAEVRAAAERVLVQWQNAPEWKSIAAEEIGKFSKSEQSRLIAAGKKAESAEISAPVNAQPQPAALTSRASDRDRAAELSKLEKKLKADKEEALVSKSAQSSKASKDEPRPSAAALDSAAPGALDSHLLGSIFLVSQCRSARRFKSQSTRPSLFFHSPLSSADDCNAFRQELSGLFTTPLVDSMLNNEFSHRLSAFDHFDRCFQMVQRSATTRPAMSEFKEILSGCLEPLLRWLGACLVDQSSKLTQRAMALILQIIAFSRSVQLKLSDGDAASLFPSLIEGTLAHNSAQIRQQGRSLLLDAIQLYSQPKVVNYLLTGLENKNKRLAGECGDLVSTLLQQRRSFSGQELKRIISAFAPQLINNDPTLKPLALALFGHLNAVAGDKFWSTIVECDRNAGNQKLNEMLEEKFHRNEKAAEEKKDKEQNKEKPQSRSEAAQPARSKVRESVGWRDLPAPAPLANSNGFQLSSMLSAFSSSGPDARSARLRSLEDIANLLSAAGSRPFLSLISTLMQILMAELSASLFAAGESDMEIAIDRPLNEAIVQLLTSILQHSDLIDRLDRPLFMEINLYFTTLIHEPRIEAAEGGAFLRDSLGKLSAQLIARIPSAGLLEFSGAILERALNLHQFNSPLVSHLAAQYRQNIEKLAALNQEEIDGQRSALEAAVRQLERLAELQSARTDSDRSLARVLADCFAVLGCCAEPLLNQVMQQLEQENGRKPFIISIATPNATQNELQTETSKDNQEESNDKETIENETTDEQPQTDETTSVSEAAAAEVATAVDPEEPESAASTVARSRRLTGFLSRQLFTNWELNEQNDENQEEFVVPINQQNTIAAPQTQNAAPLYSAAVSTVKQHSSAALLPSGRNIYQSALEEFKRGIKGEQQTEMTKDIPHEPISVAAPIALPAPTIPAALSSSDSSIPSSSSSSTSGTGLAALRAKLAAINARKTQPSN